MICGAPCSSTATPLPFGPVSRVMKTLGNEDDARAAWIPALELRPEFALRYFRKS